MSCCFGFLRIGAGFDATIRGVHNAILVTIKEITDCITILLREVLQMWNPCSHVDSHVGKFIQSSRKFMEIPLETSEMSANESKLWMFLEHVVTGRNDLFILRIFR